MDLASGTIFLAGLATFASPCVLPVIPIYLSVLMGGSLNATEGGLRARLGLFMNGLMFVLGFAAVFVLLGFTASAIGRFFLVHRLLFQQLGGLLVFLFGLKFLGWLRIEALEREKRFQLGATGQPGAKMSPWTALILGFTFAFGWTPCIGPVLGAVLTFTAVSTATPWDGARNLLLYAAGIGLPLLAVAALAQPGVRLLQRVKRFLPRIERATGVVLVAMAILMVTDNTSLLTFGVGDATSAAISQQVAPTRSQLAGGPEPTGSVVCDDDGACAIAPAPPDAGEGPGLLEGTEGRARVVYFMSPNCPACLRMTPIVNAMVTTCSGRGLDVFHVDVSGAEERREAARRGVMGTPTIIFLDAADREVARLVGTATFDAVHGALTVLMGERCADFTRF